MVSVLLTQGFVCMNKADKMLDQRINGEKHTDIYKLLQQVHGIGTMAANRFLCALIIFKMEEMMLQMINNLASQQLQELMRMWNK